MGAKAQASNGCVHQEKILLSDENVGILRALYALISAYNHLSELQNEVTATSKSDNHISAKAPES